MCAICDGATHEEFLAGTHERIMRFGFTMVGIEPDPDHPAWLYTIGLVEHHNHPELAVLGVPVEVGFAVLDELSGYVLAGERLRPGDEVVDGDARFHVATVDRRLWEGDMFNQWKQYYAWRGDITPLPSAYELVLHPAPDVAWSAPPGA